MYAGLLAELAQSEESARQERMEAQKETKGETAVESAPPTFATLLSNQRELVVVELVKVRGRCDK